MIACTRCRTQPKKDTGTRLPRGWKRMQGDAILCPSCVDAQYVLRAITFPVASPADCSWSELRDLLRDAWAESTRLANWITTECYARDVRRTPGAEKLAKMPRVYLYPEARQLFPTLPSQTIASAEQDYQAKYRAKRYKILWTMEESLPTYRYPEPYQVPAAGWSAYYDDQQRPCVSLRLGDSRLSLRLMGGHRYRRQLAAFARMVDGSAKCGAMAIYRQRSGNQSGGSERGENGHVGYRIMVKLVARLPKREASARHGTLYARTDSESLIIALNSKEERLWVWNADHVRRWVAEHTRQLQRWGDDQKAENRPPDYQDRRTLAAMRYRRRIDTAVKQCAKYLVGYAVRRRFSELRYDDSDQRYVARFPWHALRARLQTLCDEHGITLTLASGEAREKSPGSLAEETSL